IMDDVCRCTLLTRLLQDRHVAPASKAFRGAPRQLFARFPRQTMTPGLPRNPVEGERGLVVLTLLSFAAGAAVGLVGACFRLALEHADRWRDALISWAQGEMGGAGLLLVAATCGGAVAVAAWLVRRYAPHASGSGIPHVEAVLTEEIPQAPFRLIPVKFV